jgi:hypothetical protein
MVEALKGVPIQSVDVGEYHCAAVSTNGELFTWGWGGGFLYGASPPMLTNWNPCVFLPRHRCRRCAVACA